MWYTFLKPEFKEQFIHTHMRVCVCMCMYVCVCMYVCIYSVLSHGKPAFK